MIVITGANGPLIVDIPGGWATVLVALISFVVGPYVLQARANRRLKRIDQKTDRTLDHVENNHRDPATGVPINMREEADERHEENTEKLDAVLRTLVRMSRRMRAIERRLGVVETADLKQQEQIDQLVDEFTDPNWRKNK